MLDDEEMSMRNNDNITPICLSNKGNNRGEKKNNMKIDSNDEQNLLRVFMNDMKKKLVFIEKTNWMFNKNFDIQFLQAIDPKLIDEHTNVFYIETPHTPQMR